MVRPKARCGTPSGWNRHKVEDEKPCDACVRAKSDYDARRRNTPRQLLKSRIRARAQWRSYQELASRYPQEYRQLYQENLVLARLEYDPEGETT